MSGVPLTLDVPGHSRLEVLVMPGRIEVYEMYSEEMAEALVKVLRSLGIESELVFKSRCG